MSDRFYICTRSGESFHSDGTTRRLIGAPLRASRPAELMQALEDGYELLARRHGTDTYRWHAFAQGEVTRVSVRAEDPT